MGLEGINHVVASGAHNKNNIRLYASKHPLEKSKKLLHKPPFMQGSPFHDWAYVALDATLQTRDNTAGRSDHDHHHRGSMPTLRPLAMLGRDTLRSNGPCQSDRAGLRLNMSDASV